jgi:hypothetical protein
MTKKKRPRKKKPVTTSPESSSRPSPKRSVATWLLWGVGALLAALLTALLVAYPETHGPGEGRDVELVIVGDESSDALAERLHAAGLVESPRLFALYLRFTGGARRVVPGAHLVTDDLSPRDARRAARANDRGGAREGHHPRRVHALRHREAPADAPRVPAARVAGRDDRPEALLKELHLDGQRGGLPLPRDLRARARQRPRPTSCAA